uniref:ArsR family transcriptional regulator n=1 Tax=Pseudothermotoga hypogea TaxID=57487 RepID=A0A832I7M0_9THEM
MNNNELVEFFKLLANQRRLEILMLLNESCMTANEVAKSLKMDISTAFRYLDQMARKGLLRVIHTKDGDRFDLASEHIIHILEEASMLLKKPGIFSGNAVFHYSVDTKELPKPDIVLDVRGEMCPIPDLQTRNQLTKMQPGQILMVILDYPISKERILNHCKKQAYTVWIAEKGAESVLCIQKPIEYQKD